MIGLTKALALEVAGHGVLVNAIAPGPVETAMVDGISEDWKAAKRAELPLGRFGGSAHGGAAGQFSGRRPLCWPDARPQLRGRDAVKPFVAADDNLQATYRRAGFSGGFRLGQRPAILVVDFCRGFTDPSCPLGSDASAEIERARRVLDAARSNGSLVVFTTITYDDTARRTSAWLRKVPSLSELAPGSPWVEIDPLLGARPEEPLLAKTGASAFFGTPLASLFVAAGVDSVIVMGATTSGCVRASVVDSVQHGFATFVVPDCCADRAAGPHEANLFDMTAKYADPLTAEEVVGHLKRLRETVAD